MDKGRIGYVYMNDILAGIIYENDIEYIFQYNENYVKNENKPISLTLPLKLEPYKSNTLFPFFDGLIPEGWLLNVAIEKFKLDYKDRFGLLLKFCSDCIGAVSIKEQR